MIFDWIWQKCKIFDYCYFKDCIVELCQYKRLIWSFQVCEDLYNLWQLGLISTNQFSERPIYLINEKLERL